MNSALVLLLLIGFGCERARSSASDTALPSANSATSASAAASALQGVIDGPPVAPDPKPKATATLGTGPLTESPAQDARPCPANMRFIPGGEFRVGSSGASGPDDEHPAFTTRMHAFCLDRTEVTAAEYQACVSAGACTSAKRGVRTCTEGREGREAHPINCVSWDQASAYCLSSGRRLPSEVEWEYAARGGGEQRKFSWGEAPPDGQTCWKQPHTCEVAQHTEGAFGLHDMNGNVWEWTDSLYGPYPWPALSASSRVYRGGSWSRRFEKWLSPTLRNRYGEDKWGSHLGFRCAQLPTSVACPYGELDSPELGQRIRRCLHGVESVECGRRAAWNGVRCLGNGLKAERSDGCDAGTHKQPGYGCVRDEDTVARVEAPAGTAKRPETGTTREAAPEAVTRGRTPRFDADCRTYQPTRPNSYRFEGGTHAARNLVGKDQGCKNRDVGVGWNSACCP